jgi:glycosyltransferase involved in cell wall biosynthesis
MRELLGLETDMVIALYGSGHNTRLLEHCAAAITGIAEARGAPTVLNLGFAAPSLPTLPRAVRVLTPGSLPVADLAAFLAASDIALLPYLDGASTRRTTMIAALQQQTCVLSTLGALTDRELAAGPSPMLTPMRDRRAFVDAAVEIATDPDLRRRTAALGRTAFEKRFSWPVLADRIATTLSVVQPR